MPTLFDDEAIRLAIDYYEKQRGFKSEDAVRLTRLLAKIDVVGLIHYAFSAGVRAANTEHICPMKK